jgi:hypothetical protein
LISLASKRTIIFLILIALPALLFAQDANEAEAAETIVFFAFGLNDSLSLFNKKHK